MDDYAPLFSHASLPLLQEPTVPAPQEIPDLKITVCHSYLVSYLHATPCHIPTREMELVDATLARSSFVFSYRTGKSRTHHLTLHSPQFTTRALSVRCIACSLPPSLNYSTLAVEARVVDGDGHDVPVRGHHLGHARIDDCNALVDVGPFYITDPSESGGARESGGGFDMENENENEKEREREREREREKGMYRLVLVLRTLPPATLSAPSPNPNPTTTPIANGEEGRGGAVKEGGTRMREVGVYRTGRFVCLASAPPNKHFVDVVSRVVEDLEREKATREHTGWLHALSSIGTSLSVVAMAAFLVYHELRLHWRSS